MIKLIRLSAGICIISALSVISAPGSDTNNAVSIPGVIPAPKSAVMNAGDILLEIDSGVKGQYSAKPA